MRLSPVDNARSAWKWLVAIMSAVALIPTPAALAAPTNFSSSFEAGDAQPTWTDTVDDGRSSGVTGPTRTGEIPGNQTDKVVAVRASGEFAEAGEVKENLVDGSAQSKWLVFASSGWVEFEFSEAFAGVHYALTSANDAPERDPRDWTLSGSNDGQSWTLLDQRSGEDFGERFQTKEYRFQNTTAYRFYRLDITANQSGGILQLAEFQLSNGDTGPPPPSGVTTRIGSGPRGGYNAKSGAGFTGLKALRYAGTHTADGRGYSYNKVFDVDVEVGPRTELSYLIYADFVEDDLRYPSTYASVDLAFTDGTYLSDLGAPDQHGATLSPQGQGASKTLYANQWNFKRARIGAVAAGKTIDRILVAYDNPDGPTAFGGWVDDIKIDGSPPPRDRSRPSDWVVTTRGTNSSGSFSRGNNIPATAVPHGFNFWIPVTNASSLSWLYEYHRANNSQNLPTLAAFAASHEPSPWMGERQTFQVMPSSAEGVPPQGKGDRALAFRHENEIASPHHYGVRFENGVETEIAPTDHAAMFRFTFPDGDANLVFDNVNDDASLTIDQAAGVVTGYSDVRSGLSNGATRMFVYATFDRPMTASGMSLHRRGYAKFAAAPDRTVTMRIATSLISLDQARRNLALEIAPTDTFADLRSRAQALWDEKLGVVEVEGATEDQLTTLYSNLYRLFLYPNSAYENVGTAQSPVYKHAVQSSTSTPASTPTETGAPVVDGKVYVNNGFWDTYRTAWSAYALFSPGTAGELVDGFVQQYRDGGWISRWSSPGYANLMTGTSSDVAFADAYVKGVKGFDARDAYDAALKNATVAPPGTDPNNTSVGRKGLINSIFLGFTPSAVSEGVSWALEGYVNDYGIANMAKALAEAPGTSGAERRRLRDEHEYFLSRALNYVNMFDPSIDFFQGRSADGTWKSSPEEYDPRVWGHDHDYTETNGWNFAFHVPHDGRGLANLYGGRAALAAKLDTFFSIPETAKFPGSYGGIIHEMVEARDVRMGQWGFSNQVSHHIPYMYDYAGRPAKAAEKVREVLRRMYVGSEIGQGYAGDEDNGETSAWYLFSAMGFYPLQVGSPYYAIGSPLFKKATIHRPGRDIVINAPDNSARNVYVQGLRVDGARHNRAWLSHDQLADGATLTFDMGPEPSSWATGAAAAPPSVTHNNATPRPLRDATGRGRGTATASTGESVAALFDDTSGTRASLTADRPWVEYAFAGDAKRRVDFYTLTSGPGDAAADPRSWVLKGSNNGKAWKVLDERSGEEFRWRSQTRAFKAARRGAYSRYRLELTANGGGAATTLSEVELLNTDEPVTAPLSAEVQKAVGWPGDTGQVWVDVSNSGGTPLSGDVELRVPQGWTVEPASAAFDLAPGESGTVAFEVAVPAGSAPGQTYPIDATATASGAVTTAVGAVHVASGDVVEFTPFTAAEEPWLIDPGSSQDDGAVYDGRARFADNERYFTYRLQLPSTVLGGSLALDIGNQFLVQVSPDNQTWRTVLEETQTGDVGLRNRAWRSLDLNELRGTSRTLYLRVADSHPPDGWGGWLARLRLQMERE
jgi:predicted alpha-1,2-mannosidase